MFGRISPTVEKSNQTTPRRKIMASQQDDNNNNNSQQPATRRVVVWENEWPVFRHFARSLLKVRDWVLDTTHETREIAEEATQRTTQVTQTSIRRMCICLLLIDKIREGKTFCVLVCAQSMTQFFFSVTTFNHWHVLTDPKQHLLSTSMMDHLSSYNDSSPSTLLIHQLHFD